MKFLIDRLAFRDALQRVEMAIDRKPTRPVLGGVLIEAHNDSVVLMASDIIPQILWYYRYHTASGVSAKVSGTDDDGAVITTTSGGFMLGSIEMTDRWCQFITATVGVVVVSVEYRLAPEHPFPAGIEDCYAALCWMATNADSLGVDATRIAISGQSAGGGLAAGTALMARDRGGPALALARLLLLLRPRVAAQRHRRERLHDQKRRDGRPERQETNRHPKIALERLQDVREEVREEGHSS